MKNNYHIINKHPNQTWEQWESKRKPGEEISIPWNWMYNKSRKVMFMYKRKGLCKQVRGNRGLDVFQWVGCL